LKARTIILQPIVELHFDGGKAIALTDRMKNAHIKLNPVDKEGVDALELNFKYLKQGTAKKNGHQAIAAGPGPGAGYRQRLFG
jgi:hypothetical protein